MKTMYARLILVPAVLFSCFSFPSLMLAEETLVIATRENTVTNRYAETALKEIYSRLGITIKFAVYPGARSVMEANEGRADGEAARLQSVLSSYPNLMLVPVPLFQSDLSAFVHKEYKANISGWESLSSYSLTTIRGFEHVRNKLSGQTVRIVTTSSEAIELVEKDLVEVAVLNGFIGQLAIAETAAKNVVKHPTAIEHVPVYHLLHKKHASLIPKLTAVMEGMTQDGSLQGLWEDFVARELVKTSKKASK